MEAREEADNSGISTRLRGVPRPPRLPSDGVYLTVCPDQGPTLSGPVAGALVLTGGLLLMVGGLLLWRDTHGILTRYYAHLVRVNRRLPMLGEAWLAHTPFSAFRTQMLLYVLIGIAFAGIGLFVLLRSF
jgi:hypothetical protein